MRFLVLVLVGATKDTEARVVGSAEDLRAMGAFNETLSRDGVLLAAEGLQPVSKAARISFADRKPTVRDGPFTESKELVAGFWILQARSQAEIVERLSRAPFKHGEYVEIRQIFELEDLEGIV
jgi:hypothetical protein